jgi:hypothetical protein
MLGYRVAYLQRRSHAITMSIWDMTWCIGGLSRKLLDIANGYH